MQYDYEIADAAKKGSSSISDVRLAAHFDHKKNETTTLISMSEGGMRYDLVLSGHLFLQDNEGTLYEGDEVPEDIIQSLEDGDGAPESWTVLSTPWFEWIDSDGDAASDCFDSIELDPKQEITQFRETKAGHS